MVGHAMPTTCGSLLTENVIVCRSLLMVKRFGHQLLQCFRSIAVLLASSKVSYPSSVSSMKTFFHR